jgi:hypothetical protein
VTFSVFAAFAFASVGRHDGLSLNQRYFLETLPLAAVAFAWALDGVALDRRWLALGFAGGGALVLLLLLGMPLASGADVPLWQARQVALLKTPVVLAAALGVLWMARGATVKRRLLLVGTVGACLGWGMVMHVAGDVPVSRALRERNLQRTQALSDVLTDRSALVAYWGAKDAAGPLLLDRDIVILDASADDGEDAPLLIRELLGQNRPVFLVEDGFPPDVLDRVLTGLRAERLASPALKLLRLSAAPELRPAGV